MKTAGPTAKADSEAKAVPVDQSPVAALADASEITGLTRDQFRDPSDFERRVPETSIRDQSGTGGDAGAGKAIP